jgi:hypothetical protein
MQDVDVKFKFRISMAKAAFSKKKTVFTSKLDINLKKNSVKYYIFGTAFYGDAYGWRSSAGLIV